MHVQNVQNYYFSSSNMQIFDVLMAVVVVVAQAPYREFDWSSEELNARGTH